MTDASNVAVFDYAAWQARYPELGAWVNDVTAQLYFDEATLYCNNSPQSIVQDLTVRRLLLNMLTAHIAALNAPLNGQESSPIVGRISNATEGSVSVQATADYAPGSAQWFNSTKYGSAFWQASSKYRQARFVSPYQNVMPRGF